MFRFIRFAAGSGFRIPLFLSTLTIINSNKAFCSQPPPMSEIIRGTYENKIRRYSPPEKIFEVFASHQQDGELKMNMDDLLKAICFYNYCVKVEVDKNKFYPENLSQFVKDKGGLISIYDYFNLVTFLEIKLEDIPQDLVHKRKLDADDFIRIFKITQEHCHTELKSNIILESRKVKIEKKKMQQSIEELAERIVRNGNIKNFADLRKYHHRFLKEIYKYEFYTLPKDSNETIDAADFAKSIVKYVDYDKMKKFINKAKVMNSVVDVRITLEEYVGYHLFLKQSMKDLKQLCRMKGALTHQLIHETINQNIKKLTTKYLLKKQQSEILVNLLDEDSSGFVEKRELETILNHANYYSTQAASTESPWQKMKSDWKAMKDKFHRIMQIIRQ